MTHTHPSRSPTALLGTRMSHAERAAPDTSRRLSQHPGLSQDPGIPARNPGRGREGSAPREQEGITKRCSWIFWENSFPKKLMERWDGTPREGAGAALGMLGLGGIGGIFQPQQLQSFGLNTRKLLLDTATKGHTTEEGKLSPCHRPGCPWPLIPVPELSPSVA